jgi:hypothetical protein
MQIALIVVDALRPDHLACYGSTYQATPGIDAVARAGVLFRNAITQAPATRPSITAMMTGLYSSQHTLVVPEEPGKAAVSAAPFDQAVPTLPDVLRNHGFATGAFLNGIGSPKWLFGIRGCDRSVLNPDVDGGGTVRAYVDWIRDERPRNSFAYLHLMDVHRPLPSALSGGQWVAYDEDPDPEIAGVQTLHRYYTAAVRRADAHIAHMLEEFERGGLLDDCWIIVTADHGEELNEHGSMLSHGRTLYREVIHVPLVMRLPGGAYPGRVVDEPVELIDLMPTIFDHTGVGRSSTLGRSLMPLVRRNGASRRAHRPAFSELLVRERYVRSFVTPTHQLIETYHFRPTTPAGPGDLRAGVRVEVKGQPVRDSVFLATKITLDPWAQEKVLGPVQHVDPERGRLVVMGLEFDVDGGTRLSEAGGQTFDLVDLGVDERVNIVFGTNGDRRLVRSLARRRRGGESKIEGVIESVEERDGTPTAIVVLGQRVVVRHGDVRIVHARVGKTAWSRCEALAMIADGRYAAVDRELYDLRRDPIQRSNRLAELPTVARELERRLSRHAAAMADAAEASSVDENAAPSPEPDGRHYLRKL